MLLLSFLSVFALFVLFGIIKGDAILVVKLGVPSDFGFLCYFHFVGFFYRNSRQKGIECYCLFFIGFRLCICFNRRYDFSFRSQCRTFAMERHCLDFRTIYRFAFIIYPLSPEKGNRFETVFSYLKL